jgi:hypothetical protein
MSYTNGNELLISPQNIEKFYKWHKKNKDEYIFAKAYLNIYSPLFMASL